MQTNKSDTSLRLGWSQNPYCSKFSHNQAYPPVSGWLFYKTCNSGK